MAESKLQIVRASLTSDLRIELVHTEEDEFPRLFDSNLGGRFRRINYDATYSYNGVRNVHNVDFRVAPERGIYNIKELQSLLDKLVPQLKPDIKENFEVVNFGEEIVKFGKLHFYDVLGREKYSMKREIELNDEELKRFLAEEKRRWDEANKKDGIHIRSFIDKYSIVNGRGKIEEKVINEYRRTTTVSLFPDKEYISDMSSYNIGCSTKLGFDKNARRFIEDICSRKQKSILGPKHPSEGTTMKIFKSYRPLLARIFS